MTSSSKIIIKWGGILAGSAAIASVSAFITTRYLLKMAVDREEPKLMKLAGKRVAGFAEDDSFFKARLDAGDRLSKKESETVDITSHDGILLVGHWIPAVNAKRILIAVHGWRASWYETFGIVSDSWMENDCSVLYIEQRAHDNSGGEYMGFGLTERFDCLDWVSWVNRNIGTDLPIYLVGVSMGAATVLMAADLCLPENVHGIIADCGYTSPHAIWKHVANNNLHITYGVRGMIAGGRYYLHINANGDIEPCAFIHYSDSNIHEKSLLDAYRSPLFMAYHDNQPFCDNHLRPCPLLDNPGALSAMVECSQAHSTDLQAPEDVWELSAKCKGPAEKWKPVADRLWEERESGR